MWCLPAAAVCSDQCHRRQHGGNNGAISRSGQLSQLPSLVSEIHILSLIRGIPKLFFIDACRGGLHMGAVVAERGGTAVPLRVVPQYGNSLVAHSTMSGYKSHEFAGRGGMWMSQCGSCLPGVPGPPSGRTETCFSLFS